MKKDIQLVFIGIAIGIGFCSVLLFLELALFDNHPISTPIPVSISTSSPIPNNTATFTKKSSTFTPRPTYTPYPRMTSTPHPPYTKTPLPTKTEDARKSYAQIYNRELYTYADSHKGEKVVVQGTIFNINNTTELQIFAGGSSDYPMYLVFNVPFSGIYEDDYIIVYAVVDGQNCGTNAFGGQICQPLLYVDFWEKK